MKRCPECRRDYYDDTLLYCLDDGNALLEGPATASSGDDPATAILHSTASPGEAPTRAQINVTDQTEVLPTGTGDIDPKPRGFDRRLLFAPLVLAVIVLGGLFGYRYITPVKQIESIAVMPFVNESGNADVEYLSDGMTETLINNLSQIPSLSVKARSSVFRYKGKEIDPKKIASELDVQAILIGRIIQRGEQITLSLELIDAHTENTLWGNKYERKSSELVALQSEVARDVSGKLKSKLSGADEAKVTKNYTENVQAYQLYLKGRYHLGKRAASELRLAIENFKQAINADPNFALAYAGLADGYSLLPIYDNGNTKGTETMPLAKQAVQKALSLDEYLAEAHASLALIHDIFDWDTTSAEKHYTRAIELNPNYATTHQWYGEMLCNLGRFDEGLVESRRALEVEPFLLPANMALGVNFYKARRYDEAIEQLKRTLELSPNYTDTNIFLYETYVAKGAYPEAVATYIRQGTIDGISAAELEKLQRAFDKNGWQGFLQARVASFESGAARNLTSNAELYAMVGDRDKAMQWLEKAFADRDEGLTWLLIAPHFDNLRDDPRFQEFVKRVGFSD